MGLPQFFSPEERARELAEDAATQTLQPARPDDPTDASEDELTMSGALQAPPRPMSLQEALAIVANTDTQPTPSTTRRRRRSLIVMRSRLEEVIEALRNRQQETGEFVLHGSEWEELRRIVARRRGAEAPGAEMPVRSRSTARPSNSLPGTMSASREDFQLLTGELRQRRPDTHQTHEQAPDGMIEPQGRDRNTALDSSRTMGPGDRDSTGQSEGCT